MWNLPEAGIKLMSPALAGGFITTWGTGKSSAYVLDTEVASQLLSDAYCTFSPKRTRGIVYKSKPAHVRTQHQTLQWLPLAWGITDTLSLQPEGSIKSGPSQLWVLPDLCSIIFYQSYLPPASFYSSNTRCFPVEPSDLFPLLGTFCSQGYARLTLSYDLSFSSVIPFSERPSLITQALSLPLPCLFRHCLPYKLAVIYYILSPAPPPRASLVAQLVKNPPAMRGTLVRSLGWEDPLAKRKATHSSILACRITWTV